MSLLPQGNMAAAEMILDKLSASSTRAALHAPRRAWLVWENAHGSEEAYHICIQTAGLVMGTLDTSTLKKRKRSSRDKAHHGKGEHSVGMQAAEATGRQRQAR